jgi:bifunctional non-homologous end joining protein LigD
MLGSRGKCNKKKETRGHSLSYRHYVAAYSPGFIAPCLPTKTLPSGSQWLHEIKHDGFRIVARKDAERVRLS